MNGNVYSISFTNIPQCLYRFRYLSHCLYSSHWQYLYLYTITKVFMYQISVHFDAVSRIYHNVCTCYKITIYIFTTVWECLNGFTNVVQCLCTLIHAPLPVHVSTGLQVHTTPQTTTTSSRNYTVNPVTEAILNHCAVPKPNPTRNGCIKISSDPDLINNCYIGAKT